MTGLVNDSLQPALYIVRYVGAEATNMGLLARGGFGVMYVGCETILGVDVRNIRYHGTYAEKDDRILAQITMTPVETAEVLVTGDVAIGGDPIEVVADWPIDFGDGSLQQAIVGGNPVGIVFEKIGNLP